MKLMFHYFIVYSTLYYKTRYFYFFFITYYYMKINNATKLLNIDEYQKYFLEKRHKTLFKKLLIINKSISKYI